MITSLINKIPSALRLPLAIVAIAVVSLLLFYKGTQLWNGVGNFFFHRQINAERQKVKQELDSAAQQKQVLEQTLIELAKSKEELAAAKKEREIREQIFNDKTKTAREKVAAYEEALSDPAVRTDPAGVTTDDLCARAKAIGSSPATVAALCGQ